MVPLLSHDFVTKMHVVKIEIIEGKISFLRSVEAFPKERPKKKKDPSPGDIEE